MPEQQLRAIAPRMPSSSIVPGLPEQVTAHHRAAILQSSSLFADISESDRGRIVAAAQERKFSRRQTLFLEGDTVRNIILLTSGCAKILQFGQSGTEVILRLSGPGEIVGAIGLCVQGRHCSMAQTLNASTALVWDANAFESLSNHFPTLRRNAMHILCQRLHELEERFREISTEKVSSRLSKELIRLHNQVGRPVKGSIEIGLSREEMAQMTGTTLFTVSRLLSEWDQLGIVSARREAVSVLNLQALQELADGGE
jgi:CRP-like cAMP-binding protein